MAYDFSGLKTKLQTQIGDPNLSDSVAGDALNYTEQEIFGKFELTLNSGTQTNAVAQGANTLTSAMPTDFQRVTNLRISAPAGLAGDLTPYFLTVEQFRDAYPDAGTYTGPLQYWTYYTSIVFATLASAAVTITLDYIKTITLMSASSDVPTIPQSFEEMLMLGAKMRVYEQKEDFDYANQFANRFADLQESFVARYSTRQVDTPMVIPGARTRVMRFR